ncbi:trifunctional hydroxymethylpyrimidine kinase/phosphomethylpyrimidine kinase/thiaminase [Parahypoxylon ruwenzoriense]
MENRRILVIAGSDSSGGAGLEADQKVIAAHGCYAMTATTALTAQNTTGVNDIHHVPPEFVRKQVDAVFSDIHPGVVKTGAQLLPSQAVDELRTLLLPQTFILTPNIPEAELLISYGGKGPIDIQRVEDLEEIARRVQELGPKWVLVKGGHVPFKKDGSLATTPEEKEIVVDLLFGEGKSTRIESPYIESKNTHGTGCSLASAIASNLSKGMKTLEAVRAACRGHFLDYLLERPDVSSVWHRFVNHEFVISLGSGELPLESFKRYLIQDYLYLVHFARANALASYKAKSIEDIAAAAKIVIQIHTEMKLHLDYCKEFGISKEEIEATEEHQACTAYTRYVLDIGQSEDWLGLQVALAPCLLGYGAIAAQLHRDPRTKAEGNTYWKWILNYVAEDYVQAVQTGSGENCTKHPSPSGDRTTLT